MAKRRLKVDEPAMSDLTILVSVEDLISMAMGPPEENTVNYKMLQQILHILARQMRLLETKVDIKIAELPVLKKRRKRDTESPMSDNSPEQAVTEASEEGTTPREGKKKSKKPKAKFDDDTSVKDKPERKSPRMLDEIKSEGGSEKQQSDDESESDEGKSLEKKAKKLKLIESELLAKMTPAEKETYMKQMKEEEIIMKNMSPEEKENYLKDKENQLINFDQMSPKEKDKYLKDRDKDLNALKNMSIADKKKYFKEKEDNRSKERKESKATWKEDQKTAKESTTETEAKRETMTPKEKKEYDKRSKEGKESRAKGKEDQKTLKDSPTETEERREKITSKDKEEYDSKQKKQKGVKSPASEIEEDRERMTPKQKEAFDKKQKQLKEKEEEEEADEKYKITPKEKQAFDRKQKQQKEDEDKREKVTPKEKEAFDRKQKQLKEKEEEEEADEKYKKMTPKEKQAFDRKQKQQKEDEDKREKMTPKEKEAFDRKKKQQMAKAGFGPDIGTAASSRSRTSIEVVTLSQFRLLEAEVERLKKVAAPLPLPALPTDQKLKDDLVKGSASLTETMQAMQVSARVQAAETGLARMAGLLTQLAASGALPPSVAGQLEDARAEMEAIGAGKPEIVGKKAPSASGQRKSVAIDAGSTKSSWTTGDDGAAGAFGSPGPYGVTGGTSSRPSSALAERRASAAVSVASRFSRGSISGVRQIPITRNELDDAIQYLREDMMKQMQNLTYRAASSAETAAGTALSISEKMEIALKLNSRITELNALASDYADQLSGFDAGLTTQMQSFQEQIGLMREDLKAGLVQLDTANNNAETAAVMELTERFVELQTDQEANLLKHHHLTSFQGQLDSEVRGLVAAVEMLREQKADRDEVWDGLRDKADLSRLDGLLTEQEFARSRAELDQRFDVCYQKFDKQEAVWMRAIRDLTEVALGKAENLRLYAVKDEAQQKLRELQDRVRQLTEILGEPKAAILARLLSKDGRCGACRTSALMEVGGAAGLPALLPALRPPPDGGPAEPALTTFVPEDDAKTHTCNRWVGGSHTLVPRVARETAPAQIQLPQPVKKYAASGTDGRMYLFEEELLPCVECNQPNKQADEVKEETGAGDMEGIPVCACCLPEEKS